MTISTVQQAMIRVKGATPRSPIAVFKSSAEDCLVTVFASTIYTQAVIKSHLESNDKNYIGSFHKGNDLREVKRILMHNAKEVI